MIDTINRKSYTEVYTILRELNLFEKLPTDIREYIVDNQEVDYNFKFYKEFPLYDQIEDNNTKVIISYLYMKYLNKNIKEKEYLLNKYKENENSYQKEINEKYSYENLFKNKKEKFNNVSINDNEQKSLVIYEKSFIKRLFEKIINIFKKK